MLPNLEEWLMINAMAEGLAKSKEATGASEDFDRDWMIHAVESMLRQAFPTLIKIGRAHV